MRIALNAARLPWLPHRRDLPGIALAAALGIVALVTARALPRSPFVSSILVALALGAAVLNTPLRRLFGVRLPDETADVYAPGLRFTSKWILRLGIILMGLKVQTHFFGGMELALIGTVAAAALPSSFFVAHALGTALRVRRPLTDLLAGGTMICGASAVNAIAPIARAQREEQGVAIGVVFLFSIVALIAFRPIASAIPLSPGLAGMWSGLAVNDLSSAVAVGAQMGGSGAVMAAAAKSARILLLAPTLCVLSFVRREGAPTSVKNSVLDALPTFILGYVALAFLRAAVDRIAPHAPVWAWILDANTRAVDLLLATVAAGIGLHLALRTMVATSMRAVLVGGGTHLWIAGLTLAMITCASRGSFASVVGIGVAATTLSVVAYRAAGSRARQLQRLRVRFAAHASLSLADATALLAAADAAGSVDDGFLRRVLAQLHPSAGELAAIRDSPLSRGDGCRWTTQWRGQSGWALVANWREPGSFTPIHAHSHRLLGKVVQGSLEEVRFRESGEGAVEVASRAVLEHDHVVETDGPSTLHAMRVVGDPPVIDLQLRGPELGRPGRRMRTPCALDFHALTVGTRVSGLEEIDDRPGHAVDGALAS